MKYWVGVTDDQWFANLAARKPDEVNFWRPGAQETFKPIPSGAPFLFKLHHPNNYIVGGGYFVKYSVLPLSLAWLAFEEKNGADSQENLREKVLHYRRVPRADDHDPQIGCIVLTEPFFFDRKDWIPVPENWSSSIVVGKTYDDKDKGFGSELWNEVESKLIANQTGSLITTGAFEEEARFGESFLTRARLGQGAFRVVVTEAYNKRCAISGEKTLPVLEAAHIKPYSKDGPHNIHNGLLLRSDLHILFDRGYITVDPKLRVLISPRIKKEFENGKDYYVYQGMNLKEVPVRNEEKPGSDFLEWHNQNRYMA